MRVLSAEDPLFDPAEIARRGAVREMRSYLQSVVREGIILKAVQRFHKIPAGMVADAVQEVTEKVLERDLVSSFDPSRGAKFSTFVFKVINNLIKSFYVREVTRDRAAAWREVPMPVSQPETLSVAEEQGKQSMETLPAAEQKPQFDIRLSLAEGERLLSQLPFRGTVEGETPLGRRVMTPASVWELTKKGFTQPEIAAMFGVTAAAVSLLYLRAVNFLREHVVTSSANHPFLASIPFEIMPGDVEGFCSMVSDLIR